MIPDNSWFKQQNLKPKMYGLNFRTRFILTGLNYFTNKFTNVFISEK